MSSVSRMVSQAHVMSMAMALLKEFRLSGRFNVMVATCSATSNKIVSRSKGLLLAAAGHKQCTLLRRFADGCGGPTASHTTEDIEVDNKVRPQGSKTTGEERQRGDPGKEGRHRWGRVRYGEGVC